jgi:hypothetical protein
MTPEEENLVLRALVHDAWEIFMNGYLQTAQKEEKGKREAFCRFDRKCRELRIVP